MRRGGGRLLAVLALLLCLSGLAVPRGAVAAPGGTGSIVGQVVDDLGRPLPDVAVRVVATTEPYPQTSSGRSDATVADVRTDALGRYAAPDVPARDDYVLRYAKDGFEPVESHIPTSRVTRRTVAVAAGQVVTENIGLVELSVTVRGRLVDFAGNGIAGGHTTFGPTADDGTFEGRMAPGETVVEAFAPGFLPRYRYPSIWETEVLVRGERGQTIEGVAVTLRRLPTEDCWAEDGSWMPAGGPGLVTDEHGNTTQKTATTPTRFPYEAHLCPDTDGAVYRRAGPREPDVRIGVPAVPLPRPAVPFPVAPKPTTPASVSVGTGILRPPTRIAVRGRSLTVSARCAAACGGRIVATVRRPKARGRRATHVVVATGRVATGTGTRRLRLTLTTTGLRTVRTARRGVVATLRWTAPGQRTAEVGPRVRLVARR